MADPVHLDLLKQEVKAWNNWRKENPVITPSLSEANLSETNLSRANLSRANLSRANLRWANLRWANLFRADLSGADLSGADLSGADLSGAKLSGAKLNEADLSRANLFSADLFGANLSRADLSWANLREANLFRANLSGAKLSETNLFRANLEGVDMEGVDLEGAIVKEPRLSLATPPVLGGSPARGSLAESPPFGGLSPIKLPNFKLSISHPKSLSKRFTSSFIVHIYLPSEEQEVEKDQREEFSKQSVVKHTYMTELQVGATIKVTLSSPEITFFNNPVTKELRHEQNKISFLGRPSDSCQPGHHIANLAVSNPQTGTEYQSINFSVQIADFAFDHVSRPLLSSVTAVLLSMGSLVIYMLTLIQQVDTVFGLASGTVGMTLAGAIYFYIQLFYRRVTIHKES